MKLNTIARIIAAVILSLSALAVTAGAASADEPDRQFNPPYAAPC